MNLTGRRRLAVALAACLATAPGALAGPLYDPGGPAAGETTPASVRPAAAPAGIPAPPIARQDGGHSIPAGPVPSVISAESGGFSWSDAGVGFATASGLALLAGGSLLVSRRLRGPQQHRGTA